MVAATHCFDLDLMDTVVKRNMNPIEKVERSMLIMANTIHQASIEDMTTPDNYARIRSAAPELVEHTQPAAIEHTQPATIVQNVSNTAASAQA